MCIFFAGGQVLWASDEAGGVGARSREPRGCSSPENGPSWRLPTGAHPWLHAPGLLKQNEIRGLDILLPCIKACRCGFQKSVHVWSYLFEWLFCLQWLFFLIRPTLPCNFNHLVFAVWAVSLSLSRTSVLLFFWFLDLFTTFTPFGSVPCFSSVKAI